MATIKANKNKKGEIISYRFRACLGRDDLGKQIFTSKTVDPPADLTPAKAMKKMKAEAEAWEEAAKKGYVPTKKLTFRRFIEDQFIPVHVCNGKHSASTVFFYKSICNLLVERFGKKQLDAIKPLDIERYLVELQTTVHTDRNGEQSTYSSSYVQHFRTVLTVAFGFAEKHALVERNPMRRVSSIKAERKTIDFLSEEEAKRFLQLLEEDASTYWKLAMNVMIMLGVRRGELVALQWEDIDFINSTISISRDVICNKETGHKPLVKETKSVNADRVLPMPPSLSAMLLSWKKEQIETYGLLLPHAFVFGNAADCYTPARPDNVTRWLRRFNEKHGLRQVSPHDLRHTAGTLLKNSGASVKEIQTILGHYDASVTLRYYVGTDMESLKSASDRLANMLAINE